MAPRNESQIKDYMQRVITKLDHVDYSDLIIDCNDYFQRLPIPVFDFPNSRNALHQNLQTGANLVYRARLNEPGKRWNHISEISFIPEHSVHKIIDFGRVNQPKQSMFYGAFNMATACVESVTKGNVFEMPNSPTCTVGVWKIESPLIWAELPHSAKHFEAFWARTTFRSESIRVEHIEKWNKELVENIKKSEHYRGEIDIQIMQFFAEEFAKFDIKSNSDYKLSNYYADRVFNRIKGFELQEDVDAIIYPSIASSYQHKNIVMRTGTATTKLKFQYALDIWMPIHKGENGGIQFIPLKQFVRADGEGKLDWSTGMGRG